MQEKRRLAIPFRKRAIPLLLLVEFEKLDVKGELAAGFSEARVLTVGEICRDPKTAFFSFGHKLDAFGPTFDDLIEPKFGRLTALVGTVEDLAVFGLANVVQYDRAERVRGGAALTGTEELVLQAAIGFLDSRWKRLGRGGFLHVLIARGKNEGDEQ